MYIWKQDKWINLKKLIAAKPYDNVSATATDDVEARVCTALDLATKCAAV
jgi:hypothetical protein